MTSLLRKSLRRSGDVIFNSSKPKGSEFTINLLDGDTKTVFADRKDKGQALLNKVMYEIDLNEHEYFGLCWRDKNGLRIWMDPEKPIRKQLTNEETALDFTVRFYAEDPCQLTEEYTRYFFCLQIKQDLLAGRLPCSFYTGALLASYAVQAEVGDYDPDSVDVDGIPSYIKEMEFVPGQNEEFECQVAEFHKSHAGQTPSDAEMNMLDKVKRLELYGVDLHLAMDLEGIRLYIGISPTGIRIYQAGDMVRMNSFNWAKVLQVSFHKDKFYVQLRPSEKSVVKDKIGFRIPSVAACKVLWKSCVDHHTFFRLYVAEKRMPAVFGLFRSGSKYRASVRGTQKQALERSKSCHALAEFKEVTFERTPSQRIGKSRSEGAINLLGAKPYVRNSFYDTYRSAPSDERLNKQGDSFMVTTTVSPVERQPSAEDDHVYNNMANTLGPKFVPEPAPEEDHMYANHGDIPPPNPRLDIPTKAEESSGEEESSEEEDDDEEEEEEHVYASHADHIKPAPAPDPPAPEVNEPPKPPSEEEEETDEESEEEESGEEERESEEEEEEVAPEPELEPKSPAVFVPPPPPPSYQEPEKEIPLYTAVVKPKPPVVAAKPVLPTKTQPQLTVDSNRAKSASPIPSNTNEPPPVVEYDTIDIVRAPVVPPKPTIMNGDRKQPEADKLKNKFNEKENEEKLPWHDKSQYNLDDEWLELDRLTQDVARMTDDLAMDLDLDGPEKNVYVVNPQKPVNFNAPRGLEAAPPPSMGYGTPPAVPSPPSSRPYQSPRQYSPRQQEPPSPGIINDTPSAADIMKKWQQRERQTKNETRSYH
ncbi:band 4.1-like protein 3 isoform X16 [Bolinopsis microptera]|uniref:band 4.1-like protein 3 isoform X16 n=1 Tax=Bolinopsis microptera TaxID=2820187 RepID=UPI00307AA6A4